MWSVAEGIDALKRNGAKITSQRVAILRHLEGRLDHPSADTLFRELSSEFSTMSVATLYSTAQLLSYAGLLKILSIDHKKISLDPNIEPHGHFFCKDCGKIYDIPFDNESVRDCAALNEDIAEVENTELFIYGLCKECSKQLS